MNNTFKYWCEIGFSLNLFHFSLSENKVRDKKKQYIRSNYEDVWI